MIDPAKTVLVVGGGAAGMEAALRIAQAGYAAVLVEKQPEIGGTLRELHSSFPAWENPRDVVAHRIGLLAGLPRVTIRTGTVLASSRKTERGFQVSLKTLQDGNEDTLDVDAVVLATGAGLMDASVYGEYGHGIYPGVLNSLEFEARLKQWASGAGDRPNGVALVSCVGSRDRSKGVPYCSAICCMITAKQAGLVKDLFPGAGVYVFYMDYRASGRQYEEFVRQVIEEKQVKYVRGRPSKVLPDNGRLLLKAEDTLMGIPVEVSVDLVVLASAIVPHGETAVLAELFGCRTDGYGFLEADPLEPLRCAERVFFAGGCGFAIESAGARNQGAAAAASVIALLSGRK